MNKEQTTENALHETVLQYIKENGVPVALADIADALAVEAKQRRILQDALEAMEEKGALVRTKKGKWALPAQIGLIAGKLQGHANGFGFLLPDDVALSDIFLPPDALHGALHGDRVLVRRKEKANPRGEEGEVVAVTERANDTIVGLLRMEGREAVVECDDKRLPSFVQIPRDSVGGARNGDKVVLRVVRYPSEGMPMQGRVIEVIGAVGDAGTDITSIVRQHHLPDAFPEAVLREAEQMPKEVALSAAEGREDWRGACVITIDGADAKDLDDAVSLTKDGDGWELSVHIADVSHYVAENSALDQEAYRRGNSVYLLSRVIPMLPPSLSNGICSLHGGVMRLCVSAVMRIERGGRVSDFRFARTVIQTRHRMTYEDVNAILGGDAALRQEYADIVPMLEEMRTFMQVLYERRRARGSVDLDVREAKITLDASGVPVAIEARERGDAEKLIEECMLLANECVARAMHEAKVPFLYRVHEDPDPDKMEQFRQFIGALGYSLRKNRKIKPIDLQRLMQQVQQGGDAEIISRVLLRSLQKARYSPQNAGHFGLAAQDYCHFTSPIRRYSDLVVHRILCATIEGRLDAKRARRYDKVMPDTAKQCSLTERAAMEAERDVDDLKKAEFMQRHIGEVFGGVISGVTSFGLFVALENTVEGLVHVSTMRDDMYRFDERLYRLVGDRTHRVYRLGDAVRICVARADAKTRTIDFTLSEEKDAAKPV